MYASAQINAVMYVPVGTGSMSFMASGALIVMILFFSRIKLSVACRRIVFGLCVYDVFFSLANAVASFAIPANQGFIKTSGTVGTCDVQG